MISWLTFRYLENWKLFYVISWWTGRKRCSEYWVDSFADLVPQILHSSIHLSSLFFLCYTNIWLFNNPFPTWSEITPLHICVVRSSSRSTSKTLRSAPGTPGSKKGLLEVNEISIAVKASTWLKNSEACIDSLVFYSPSIHILKVNAAMYHKIFRYLIRKGNSVKTSSVGP